MCSLVQHGVVAIVTVTLIPLRKRLADTERASAQRQRLRLRLLGLRFTLFSFGEPSPALRSAILDAKGIIDTWEVAHAWDALPVLVPLIAPIIFLCVGASRLRKASATPGHASMRRSIAVRSSATGFGGSGASDACLPLPFGEVIVVSTPVAPRIAAADAAASPQSKPKCAASLTQCSECIT